MMFSATCPGCKKRVIVRGTKEEFDKIKGTIKCPLCEYDNVNWAFLIGQPHPKDSIITVDEFLFYTAGLALPGEIVTQKEAVVGMFRAHRIVDLDAEETPRGFCCIKSILLDNGVRFYFAVSGDGPVIWRAVKEKGEKNGRKSIES
jgi:hypothetical protein